MSDATSGASWSLKLLLTEVSLETSKNISISAFSLLVRQWHKLSSSDITDPTAATLTSPGAWWDTKSVWKWTTWLLQLQCNNYRIMTPLTDRFAFTQYIHSIPSLGTRSPWKSEGLIHGTTRPAFTSLLQTKNSSPNVFLSLLLHPKWIHCGSYLFGEHAS